MNEKIRTLCRVNHVAAYEIGDELGVSENTIYRRLRHELTPDDQKLFLDAIEKISAEKRIAIQKEFLAARQI